MPITGLPTVSGVNETRRWDSVVLPSRVYGDSITPRPTNELMPIPAVCPPVERWPNNALWMRNETEVVSRKVGTNWVLACMSSSQTSVNPIEAPQASFNRLGSRSFSPRWALVPRVIPTSKKPANAGKASTSTMINSNTLFCIRTYFKKYVNRMILKPQLSISPFTMS